MALSINTNVAALNAYRNLNTTQNDLSKSLEKLSSGFRINRAADDAAGLAISEGMRSQIGGIKMGVRNAQDGISLVQTAEGALNETHSILQRMRDLSVQAANSGGLNTEAKTNIQTEIKQLNSELSRIADTTKFNGKALLSGAYTGSFQVGANVGETIDVAVGQNMSALGLKTSGLDVSAPEGAGYIKGLAQLSTTAPAALAAGVIGAAGSWTAATRTLTFTVDGGANQLVDVTGVTDGAGLAAAINTANLGVTAKWDGAGAGLTLGSAKAFTAVAGGAGAPVLGTVAAATVPQIAANDLLASGANKAITAIDSAITKVSTTRSDLGAVQNRFEHTINNLNVAVENLTASESRIRDTDMASEMISFTRSQILSQAGTAMLAQAKSIPQGVLQLLQ